MVGIPPGATYAFTIANVYLPVVGQGADSPRCLQLLFEYLPQGIPALPSPLLVMGFNLLNPASLGSVNLQSANPFEIAAADDAFYQNPTDLTNMKNAIQTYVRAILAQFQIMYPFPSPFFRPVITDQFNLVILGGFSDDSVISYIKNNTNLADIHHFSSENRMGPLESGNVVDGDLRVHGTANLFCADNSICPTIPDINTTGPAMMIGMRASSILKRILGKQKPIYRESKG